MWRGASFGAKTGGIARELKSNNQAVIDATIRELESNNKALLEATINNEASFAARIKLRQAQKQRHKQTEKVAAFDLLIGASSVQDRLLAH